MPRYSTFSIRMTIEERQTVEMKAKARGMSLGQYMRFRCLAPEKGRDGKVIAAYQLLKEIVDGSE